MKEWLLCLCVVSGWLVSNVRKLCSISIKWLGKETEFNSDGL